jgi:hypothetical protein
MASRGPKRRLSKVALALLGVSLLAGIAAPIIVSVGSNRITVDSSTLNAAPRDSYIVTAPTALGRSGFAMIERGTLYSSDANGRASEAPLNAAQVARGDGRFVIDNGVLRLRSTVAVQVTEPDGASLMVDAVSGLQFETLYLRRTTIHVTLPDGRVETIDNINGQVTNRRKAALVFSGKGDLRGQRVDFDGSIGLRATEATPGATAPLKLSLRGGLLSVSFDGQAGFVGPAQLQGDVEFNVPNVRQVARLFGAPWPAGSGLRNLNGRGQLDWAGPAMAFNRATFQMDANEATGTLHLKFADARPSIGGTLAMKTLDLGRYFPGPGFTFPGAATSFWAQLLSTDLTLPLALHFDSDLRLSADRVKVGPIMFGRAAAAVTVSQGRMLADVGTFEFDGGRGSGQISADMSGSIPKVSVRGRLDEVDMTRATTSMMGHPVFGGRATVTVDVMSSGRTGDNLLATSSGRVNMTVRNGGRIGADLRGLAAAAQKRAIDGWGSATRGQTAFDELDGAFTVRSGVLVADDAKARSGEVSTVLSGAIDVGAGRVNMSVVQIPAGPDPRKPLLEAVPSMTLQIFGPWAKPTVRNNSTSPRDRAAEPSTAGDVPPARL